MKRFPARGLLAAAWLTLATSASAASAQDRTVEGEVQIILAEEAEGTIDPRLANLEALRRAPFNLYRTLTLHSSRRIQLRVNEPRELPLPNGRRIRLVLWQITSEGRYRIRVSINRPGQRDYLPEMSVRTSPGDPFFVAGQGFQRGTLVVGIRLSEP